MNIQKIKKNICKFGKSTLLMCLLATSSLQANDNNLQSNIKAKNILQCVTDDTGLTHYLTYSDKYVKKLSPKGIRKNFSYSKTEIFAKLQECGLSLNNKTKSEYTKEFLSYAKIYSDSKGYRFSNSVRKPFKNIAYGKHEKRAHQYAIDLFVKKDIKKSFMKNPNVFTAIEGLVLHSTNKNENPSSDLCGREVLVYNPSTEKIATYCHFDKVYVKRLITVEHNDIIGQLGNTGLRAKKTTPHVHFELATVSKNGSITHNSREEVKKILEKSNHFDPLSNPLDLLAIGE